MSWQQAAAAYLIGAAFAEQLLQLAYTAAAAAAAPE